jgi:hypothetical protein
MKLIEHRLFIEKPKLAESLEALQKINPFKEKTTRSKEKSAIISFQPKITDTFKLRW